MRSTCTNHASACPRLRSRGRLCVRRLKTFAVCTWYESAHHRGGRMEAPTIAAGAAAAAAGNAAAAGAAGGRADIDARGVGGQGARGTKAAPRGRRRGKEVGKAILHPVRHPLPHRASFPRRGSSLPAHIPPSIRCWRPVRAWSLARVFRVRFAVYMTSPACSVLIPPPILPAPHLSGLESNATDNGRTDVLKPTDHIIQGTRPASAPRLTPPTPPPYSYTLLKLLALWNHHQRWKYAYTSP